ncbi:MAG: hypothetical protein JXR88_11340 [Clostridia bacterium]|nr:hypothetical protein [Clostridia bacterium]
MKKIVIILLVLTLCFTLIACGDKNEKLTPEEEVMQVVKDNLSAMNNEDTDAYMKSISLESELFDATKQQMDMIFSMYDLEVTIEEMEVLEITEDEAQVRVVQKTVNNNDEAFQPNITTAVHTLKKIDGEWKFISTVIENTEFM